ncbi:MAG: tetratricopeptide repeat protein [Bacteroidales bacterium]
MKKQFLLFVSVLFATITIAQVQISLANLQSLRKNIAKHKEKTVNPKKETNPKTWISYAETLAEAYDKSRMGVMPGMHKSIFMTLKKEIKKQTVDGKEYEIFVFPNIEIYFTETGALFAWKETEVVVENILTQSYEAYLKAQTLDEKGSQQKKIAKGLQSLAAKLSNEGINAYSLLDLKVAQKNFMKTVDISMHPFINKIDTVMAYYALVMSVNDSLKDYDNAVRYGKMCMDNAYFDGGTVHLSLAKAYAAKKDSTMQEKVLQEAFVKFPKNQNILIELINMYLASGDDARKVIPFLKQAQVNEPNNSTLFFAEATLYEQLKMFEDAERMYKKTMEIDSTNYNAYYNLGALYYNKAVEHIQEANGIKDWQSPKIKELEELANAQFKKALPNFEKAHLLQPKDKYSLENVKNIYFRFRNDSPEMSEAFEKYNDKLKQLEGN